MSPSLGLLIISLYFWSAFLVQTLGIQMVNIRCPNPLHSPFCWLLFLHYTALETGIPDLLPTPNDPRKTYHTHSRPITCWQYLSGRRILPLLCIYYIGLCSRGQLHFSVLFQRRFQSQEYLPFWLYIVFTITTKPNTKYLLTTYLMLNE